MGGLLSAPAEVPAFGKTIIDYSKNCHGAWDFKRLHKLQARYLDVFKENLTLLERSGYCEQDLMSLLYQEAEAYIHAMVSDPLLPSTLLPDSYLGKKVWKLRNQLRTQIREALQANLI